MNTGRTIVYEGIISASYPAYLFPGKYLFELWGAQGGCMDGCAGAKGGYSKGTIVLRSSTNVFVSVGQQGTCTSGSALETPASFNGGGKPKIFAPGDHVACSGGGASDIRLNKNTLFHRVIVAGGGGGYGKFKDALRIGGSGGGINGTNGGSSCTNNEEKFGTQTYGGTGKKGDSNGIFGFGGNATSADGGGGGGGWFGGAAGQNCIDPGNGGSGFVLTSSSYSIAKLQSQYGLGPAYFMTHAETKVQSEVSGNGKVIITVLSQLKTCSPKITNRFFVVIFTFILKS